MTTRSSVEQTWEFHGLAPRAVRESPKPRGQTMKISIRGVLIGGIVDIVSSAACLTAFLSYEISKVDPSQRIGTHWLHAINAAADKSVLLHLTYPLCSMLGGYVAAMIAKRHEHLNGTLASWLRVGFGLLGLPIASSREELWLGLFVLVASPVCAFVGGELSLRVHGTITEYNRSAPAADTSWSSLERSLRSQQPEPNVRVDARTGPRGLAGSLSPEVRRNCYALAGLALAIDVGAGILFWNWPHSFAVRTVGLLAILGGLRLIRRAQELKRSALARQDLGDLPTTFGE